MSSSVDIEIVLDNYSSISNKSLILVVEHYLSNHPPTYNSTISTFVRDGASFCNLIKHIVIGEPSNINDIKSNYLDIKAHSINWYVYCLETEGPSIQTDCDNEDQSVTLCSHLVLPSAELFTLWENLYYDNRIKENLLKYAQTAMDFANKGVNSNIVNFNRVILLHGPPGTGKTSLCKAVAQKLAIKLKHIYPSSILVEVNSHSLFSKWYSESGKLVTKMFSKIKEICEDSNVLVSVLIDEVESLVRARDQCMSGSEPSESVRVVNAILTQIDQIKTYPNVFILTTSNMTEAIDLAFVDRADVKQYLGLPSINAIYKIYSSCLLELINVNILKLRPDMILNNDPNEPLNIISAKLMNICEKSIDLSGRTLRKIPFLAHALFMDNKKKMTNLEEFLEAMKLAIEREHQDRRCFMLKK